MYDFRPVADISDGRRFRWSRSPSREIGFSTPRVPAC